jgi:hypothetical protein
MPVVTTHDLDHPIADGDERLDITVGHRGNGEKIGCELQQV